MKFNGILIWSAAIAFFSFCGGCHWDRGAQVPDAVRYEDFGAKGDGKTCDLDALIAAHKHANLHNLPVRAKDDATYYLSGSGKYITVQTSVDWGRANFIVDDRNLQKINNPVFYITSKQKSQKVQGISALKRGQKELGVPLAADSLLVVSNQKKRNFIRTGPYRNSGRAQLEVIRVDKSGVIDPQTPLCQDFEEVTSANAYPVDPETLTVKGGIFTTIANQSTEKPAYINRNIYVCRSNVVLDGITHVVTGNEGTGFPYSGFLYITDSADVTVQNCTLSGHTFSWQTNADGEKIPIGTYDIKVLRSADISLLNCVQRNDIHDPALENIMAVNYCRNLTLDRCKFSGYQIYQGLSGGVIRNSEFGRFGILLVGNGTLLVENCKRTDQYFVKLREDYGSFWNGTMQLRNCEFTPLAGGALIGGRNSGNHDYGYACRMPEEVILENVLIRDGALQKDPAYQGPALFGDFNPDYKNDSRVEKYPYGKTKRVILKNVRTESGKPLRISDNMAMFQEIEVIHNQ